MNKNKNNDWTKPKHLSNDDWNDLAFVKKLYDDGNFKTAYKHASSLDTIVRDSIPVYILKKLGFTVLKKHKEGGDVVEKKTGIARYPHLVIIAKRKFAVLEDLSKKGYFYDWTNRVNSNFDVNKYELVEQDTVSYEYDGVVRDFFYRVYVKKQGKQIINRVIGIERNFTDEELKWYADNNMPLTDTVDYYYLTLDGRRKKGFYEEGGTVKNELSINQVETKLGRPLHWWNDDVITLDGVKYKKCFMKPFYKKID